MTGRQGILGAAIACLVAAGIALGLHDAGAQSARKAPPAEPSGVPVQTAQVTRQDVPVILHAIGTVQAFQSVLIRARVDGTLDSVAFKEGQEVKRGQLLAVIDPRPYQAVLGQVMAKQAADEAQLANAKLDLERDATLARSSFASRQVLDTQKSLVARLEANIQGDAAAVSAAQLNLAFTHITSPIDGRAGLRQIDPGNLVHATDTQGIVTITQIKPIAVLFTLPQDQLPELQDAMRARTLPVTALSGDSKTRLGEGKLLTIDNTIDQSTGTIKLKAAFPNTDERLWPGQFVSVQLLLDTLHDATTVPSPAIQRGPDGLYVYLVRANDTVAVQPVTVRQDDGKVAVIAKGLTVGATVVTNGQSKLQEGTRIVATNAAAGPRPAKAGG